MKSQKPYKTNHFKKLDSTNTYAMKNLAELSDKEVIIADVQTSGRGRLNRSWVSAREDNIYLSIVLKPCSKVSDKLPLAGLTQYMSVILCRVLENYGASAQIKWPNDVLSDGKKIAGILSQASIQGESFRGLILGTGVNLNFSQEEADKIDQPATSLNLILGRPVDKKAFTEELIDGFFENYEKFLDKGFSYIEKDYIQRCCFLGKRIAVNALDPRETGIAKEIREDGSLVLENDEMQEKIITMGDIVCLQPD